LFINELIGTFLNTLNAGYDITVGFVSAMFKAFKYIVQIHYTEASKQTINRTLTTDLLLRLATTSDLRHSLYHDCFLASIATLTSSSKNPADVHF